MNERFESASASIRELAEIADNITESHREYTGVLNVPIGALLWRCTLDDWHRMQHRVHSWTSFCRPSQAKRSIIRRMDVWMPGCANPCRFSKICLLRETGTTGLGTPVDRSQTTRVLSPQGKVMRFGSPCHLIPSCFCSAASSV